MVLGIMPFICGMMNWKGTRLENTEHVKLVVPNLCISDNRRSPWASLAGFERNELDMILFTGHDKEEF